MYAICLFAIKGFVETLFYLLHCLLRGPFPEDLPAEHNLNTPSFLVIGAIIPLRSHSAGLSAEVWGECALSIAHPAEYSGLFVPGAQNSNHGGFQHAEQATTVPDFVPQ